MAKLFRALASFDFIADLESFKKRKASRQTDDPAKRAALQSEIRWAHHGPKDKPFSAPYAEAEKSWLRAGVVEEVNE